jgi:release factor glutamine methyltransferase
MLPEGARPLLAAAAARLRRAGCDTPELDARLLLQAAAGLTREDLAIDPERLIDTAARERFEDVLRRRERREPVSRILGAREFYGRPFRVTPATLDPRPDTETLVEAALALMPEGARILDLGTGTGAIAVTLLAERPDATGVATDRSARALAVAEANAQSLGVAGRLTLLEGSWFAPVTGMFDIIMSNPPYIPAREIEGLSPDVRNFDPLEALVGGEDGLDPYRAIALAAGSHMAPGGHVVVEIGAGQADDVAAIFAVAGWHNEARHRDLAGHVRCLTFRCVMEKTVASGPARKISIGK